MVLKPVLRQSLSDLVFAQIRDRILGGDYEPGTPLPGERELAQKLGVNRGAVREALKRLGEARLVATQHGGGTRVADFRATAGMGVLSTLLFTPDGQINAKTARSIIEMRSALAPDVARLAALRADTALRAKITNAAQAIARKSASVHRIKHGAHLPHEVDIQASDADGSSNANTNTSSDGNGNIEDEQTIDALQGLVIEFWNLLVEASENIAYRLAFNTLDDTYQGLRPALAHLLRDEVLDAKTYLALSRAIEAGDGGRAQKLATVVVKKGADRILAFVDALAPPNARSRDAS